MDIIYNKKMTTEYIELCSSNRNRNVWPNESEFEVVYSNSGRKAKIDALDSVSLQSNVNAWYLGLFMVQIDAFGAYAAFPYLTVSPVISNSGRGATADAGATSITISPVAPPGGFAYMQYSDGYYNGCIITNDRIELAGGPNSRSRIKSFIYLQKNQALIELYTPLECLATDTFTISDPSDFTDPLAPLIFVPNGLNINNSYSNYYVCNETGTNVKIKSYDGITHLLLTEPGSFAPTDILSIRTEIPQYLRPLFGTAAIFNSPDISYKSYSFYNPALGVNDPIFTDMVGNFFETRTFPNSGFMTGGNSSFVCIFLYPVPVPDNYYAGMTLYDLVTQEETTIVSFDAATSTITVNPPFTAPVGVNTPFIVRPITEVYEARRITKYAYYAGTAVGGSNNTIEFDMTASRRSSEYTDLYIAILTGPNAGMYFLIRNYIATPTGGVATVQSTFTGGPIVAGDQFVINSCSVSPPFKHSIFGGISSLVPPPYGYRILSFSYDNVFPLNYVGSTVAQQQMCCYEVRLENLSLPNQILSSGNGGIIAFYPYIYVELQNVTASNSGNVNILASNNPNATKATFRVMIPNVSNPQEQRFVSIDSSMVCTMKFKPNDTLFLKITLPNGDLFKTVIPETYTPQVPNNLTQISALFSMHKIK